MSWGSSANSGSNDISPPTDAGEIPANTSEALEMEGDSSGDGGDPALPDDTVEDAARVSLVHGDTVILRQPRTMNPRPRMLVGFISRQASIRGKGLLLVISV
jgi:hypothetical protein